VTKRFRLLVLLAAVSLGPAAAQTVEGTVVNSNTGIGLAGVGVNLEQVTNGAYSVYTGRSDAQGHFSVDNVQDGLYRVRYATNDYWSADDFGDPPLIQVTAGGKPVKLEARMLPLPHISGLVVDGRGDRVANAQVDFAGSGIFLPATTDAAGRFDVRQRPGTYTLSVVPPPGLKPPDPEPRAEPGDGPALGWTRTFYPGVTVEEAASKIVLRPGLDVSDIEVKLLAVPVHAIRGVLLNPDGKPAPKVAMALVDGVSLEPAALHAVSTADGAFEFPAVPDGERLFGFEVESGGVRLRATQWIVMAGHDLEGVKVRLIAPFAVRGKVAIETSAGLPAPKPTSVVLVSVSPDHPSVLPQMMSARPDADGNFSFPHVYPGFYRIEASPPPPYYLDAVRLGEAELATPEMELAPGAAPITVVYKTNGGTVRGAVEKCASGTVLLVPQDAALRRAGFLRNARCDSNGRYEVTAVRPGEYYVLAFAGNGSMPFMLPQWDDGILNQASAVMVRAGETSSADLRAIPQPQY
jgi:hypothetical protein